jgi:hypothetical protein
MVRQWSCEKNDRAVPIAGSGVCLSHDWGGARGAPSFLRIGSASRWIDEMSVQLKFFVLFGTLAFLGYPLGCLVAKIAASRRWVLRVVGLASVILFVWALGSDLAFDGGHRYLIFAGVGLCLQGAWIVASFRIKRAMRPQYFDLWASHRDPGQKSIQTFASGAVSGGREPRDP